jgi:arabinofuranosyltransferase
MRLPRRLERVLAAPLAPYLVALALQLVFVGYAKDDAFIEFRYAHNFAHGHGLVFNVGDPPVEGFTSFLWTVLLALPARLGIDPLIFAKLCGAAALFGTIALAARLVRARGGDERAAQVARWLVATNATLLIYAQSGLESVICVLFVIAGALRLQQRRHWQAMLLLALAAATRPECHVLLLLGAALVIARRELLPVVVALALVATLHWLRFRYYGAWVPNTALVKGATFLWRPGLRALENLSVTSLAVVPIALALVAAWRARDGVAIVGALAIVAFLLYLVRVGKDEMFLSRLFLPVWPLALALAAPSLARGRLRILAVAVCLTGLGFVAGNSYRYNYIALGTRSHVALAELMKANARPGELVVFQDLGQTPWAALELRFVDPIGLVDPVIARVRYAEHASPFAHAPSEAGKRAIRDRIYSLGPKLIAFVAYIPDQDAPDVRKESDRLTDPAAREALFRRYLDLNPYHVELHQDPRFAAFRFVDVIRRKDNYWFMLYRRG